METLFWPDMFLFQITFHSNIRSLVLTVFQRCSLASRWKNGNSSVSIALTVELPCPGDPPFPVWYSLGFDVTMIFPYQVSLRPFKRRPTRRYLHQCNNLSPEFTSLWPWTTPSEKCLHVLDIASVLRDTGQYIIRHHSLLLWSSCEPWVYENLFALLLTP